MLQHILQEPAWLVIWVAWLALVNTASILFVRHREARVVLVAWLGNGVTMALLFEAVGYVRLLGLSHLLWWSPLLAWLGWRHAHVPRQGLYGRWLWTLFATNLVSLVVDGVDVVRYLLGDGAL